MSRLWPALLLLSACGPGVEPLSDVTPLLDFDGRFFDAPFPSAGRLRADGTVEVKDFPTKDSAVARRYVDALDTLGEGFGRSSAVWFPLSGPIDASSLPQTPAASQSWDSAVLLVNVDEASPAYGAFIPLEVRFKAAAETFSPAHLLVALPRQGHVLEPGTWYAAVLTRALKDTAGLSLRRAAFLDDTTSTGPRGDALRAELPRLDALLAARGRSRDEVVAATIFRTGSHLARLKAIAQAARTRPAPLVGALTVLDTFPTFTVLAGQVEVPLYQRGPKPYLAGEGGEMVFDAEGAPQVQDTEVIRFALTVPRAVMPAGGFPLLFHVPGSGGDWLEMVGGNGDGLARVLAGRGIATLCVEANLSGPRHPSGDPSGFHFYNIFNPVAVRDNHRQQAAEYEVLVTLAKGLDVPGALVPEAQAVAVSFDPARFFVHGHSTGSVVAATILASNDGFTAGALSGAGGSWLYNLVLKQTPSSAELVKSVLGYAASDEVDVFDPVLSLAATLWDPIEPMNQAPLWARESTTRASPASVLLIEGVVDTYYLPRMVSALAVAARMDVAAPTVEPDLPQSLAVVGGEVKPPPLSNNRAGVTLAVVQHEAPPGTDGHFVVFRQAAAQYQYGCFFASAVTGVPVVPPKVADALAPCP
ncbi:MAG: hypothetical protein AB1938_14430 [Myxococcota bacterium]